MERILAHHVVVDGHDYGMAIATIVCRDCRWSVEVEPYVREIHSTSFHSGTLVVSTRPGSAPEVVRK